MEQFSGLGKILVVAGAVIFFLGIFLLLLPKIPYLGKLPGDFLIEKKNFKFYFPMATSIILSVLASLILYIIRKFS